MSKKKPELKSIKVPEEVHKDLKDMGVGISKAVELLVEEKKQAITEKVEEISELGTELGQIVADYGLFDLKFAGASIETIDEIGEMLDITAHIKIILPDADVRQRIMEALKPKEESENAKSNS